MIEFIKKYKWQSVIVGVLVFALIASANSTPSSNSYTPTTNNYQTQSQPTSLSNDNYYTNVSGNTVHSPAYSTDNAIPTGATAQCGDGTYSFSQHRSGTCSHHGGVSLWLNGQNSQSQVTDCQTEAQTAKQDYLTMELTQIGASPLYKTESYAQFLQRLQSEIASATPESVASTIQFETTAYENASASTDQRRQDAMNNAAVLAQLKYNTMYTNCMNQ